MARAEIDMKCAECGEMFKPRFGGVRKYCYGYSCEKKRELDFRRRKAEKDKVRSAERRKKQKEGGGLCDGPSNGGVRKD